MMDYLSRGYSGTSCTLKMSPVRSRTEEEEEDMCRTPVGERV